MNDNTKKFMSISIWLTVVLFVIRCLISWEDIKNMWNTGNIFSLCYSFIGFIGEAISAAAIIMAVFNKWAWRWRWLSWLHDVPKLTKKYKVEFISDYDSVKRLGTVKIDQTFLSVAVQLNTDESSSRSLTASFSTVQGVPYLIYTYQNDPRAEIQDRSPIHYGTAMLNVSNPVQVDGNYFTGRKSRGSMKLEAIM